MPRNLAVMGTTCTGGGMNPLTGDKIINDVNHDAPAVVLAPERYKTAG